VNTAQRVWTSLSCSAGGEHGSPVDMVACVCLSHSCTYSAFFNRIDSVDSGSKPRVCAPQSTPYTHSRSDIHSGAHARPNANTDRWRLLLRSCSKLDCLWDRECDLY
jgi:hypothetical protein